MSKQDFEVYLARGSNLSQRYRDEATEKPSQALDSTILTASRRTPVSTAIAKPQSWFRRWRVPLSIAAVMLLSVGVTLRTVMQDTKYSEPLSDVALPQPASDPTAAPAKPVENKEIAGPDADAVLGGAASTSPQSPPLSPASSDKKSTESEVIEEVLVDDGSAPPSAAQGSADAEAPLPAPDEPRPGASLGLPGNSAPPAKEASESQWPKATQAQSGSPGKDLSKGASAERPERDDVATESPVESAKRDSESLTPPREPALPDHAESEVRPAPASPALSLESALPAPPQALPGDGPRLPEGHRPIVDGKTYRAEKAKAMREAAEKKDSTAAAAIVDKVEETPEAWLRRVAELRRLGRIDEANGELARFRARYPDFAIPVEAGSANNTQ